MAVTKRTGDEASTDRTGRQAGRGRRFPIRTKLAAALAVPLVAMGLVTLGEVVSVGRDAREVRDQTQLATAALGPNGVITALMDERNWSSSAIVGLEDQIHIEFEGWDESRSATDQALEDFERDLDRLGGEAEAAYSPALETLDTLSELRTEIDEAYANSSRTLADIPTSSVYFGGYSELIDPFFTAMTRISLSIRDADLRQGAELTEATGQLRELVAQVTNALVLPSYVPTEEGDTPGINSAGEISHVAALHAQLREHSEAMRNATGRYAILVDDHYNAEYYEFIGDAATTAIQTGGVGAIDALISTLRDTEGERSTLGYRDRLEEVFTDRADDLNASAARRQQVWVLVLGATFVGGVALTVLASMSITRPLHSLTDQASEMAERRLPDSLADILSTPLGENLSMPTVPPIQVNTRDEVADVAKALNAVQDTALDLAIEQAVLRRNIADSFVNLGRRNQNLLGRQLDFITELESNETDSDTLASLFRLDHLATRMRRNAESLLVLAGIEPPRQWAAPVRLTDVIRAALGEVEDYQRVTVREVEPATIVGSAAADLAHLLAELIENALHFSPPDRIVHVEGRRLAGATGTPGGYRLAVIDTGLGMAESDIDGANRRLATVESFTVAPSKYLGHYVAGNLAARHGIRVALHNGAVGGTTATIDLPADLLADAGELRTTTPTDPTVAGSLASPVHSATFASTTASATPSFLVASKYPAAPTTPAAPAGLTSAQLASLERVTAPAQARSPMQSGPSAPSRPSLSTRRPSPAAPRAGDGHPRPPSRPPLARRTRGARMPNTTLHSLSRSQGPQAPASPADCDTSAAPNMRAALAREAPLRPAVDVYDYLSNFTAGVQRGLDASRDTGRGNP